MSETKSDESVREFIPWDIHHETMFIDWADKAACYKWLHNKSYLKYSSKRNAFTIPVIVMSTLTGTANFALERIPAEYQSTCSIVIGSINILAGIITTVSQFLKLNELTESNRVASIAWDKFHRSIRIELIKAPEERQDVSYFMKTSRDEFDRLMETCPPIDKDIVEQFSIQLIKGKDKKEVERKLKNFNKLIKPEIFNEIHTLKDSVFKQQPLREITIDDKLRIKKLEQERENYKVKLDKLSDFIKQFKEKYSRHPSHDEIISNITDITTPELTIMINEITF